jgi:FkbM family methyltransferase
MISENLSLKYIIKRTGEQEHPFRFLFSRILWALRVCSLLKINLPHGIRLRFFPSSTSAALWLDPHRFDSDGVDFIWKYLFKRDTFVDVGANIGHLTLIAAKKAFKGKVISIEPHPRIFKFLVQNIKLNRLENVKALNFAIGEKSGESHFSDIRSDDQNFITNGGPVAVKARTLDDLPDIGKIDLLKIDTEGYELFVLRGAKKTLEKTSAVFLESYEKNFNRYGYSTKDVIDFVSGSGFRLFKLTLENKLENIGSDYISTECENLFAVKDPRVLKDRLNLQNNIGLLWQKETNRS